MRLATAAASATALAAEVRAARDPAELVEQALARLAACDDEVRSFVQVDADAARREARAAPDGPLRGVPVAVKDLFDVRGQQTRAGSRVPAGPPAGQDAPAVARLRAAGAVVLGRTRTHEYAWGLTTQHETLGGTRNPWDTTRVPGGSSGGSAAAVAAGIVPLALGTDTGCSIRLPAAWCGLVGHKPTWGAVPLDGCTPLAPSMDTGGALVRTVEDVRLALRVLAGLELGASAVNGLSAGVVRGGTLPGVAAVLDAAFERAAGVGLRLREVALPGEAGEASGDLAVTDLAGGAHGDTARTGAAGGTPHDPEVGGGARGDLVLPAAGPLRTAYAGIQAGEALDWHRATGRWPAHAEAYGSDVRGHLERAAAMTADQLAAAARLRSELRGAAARLLDEVDVLLLPVAGTGPPTTADPGRTPLGAIRDAVMPWTLLANLAGLPACSVPAGLDEDGLPVGLQVVGPPGADARVLDVAERLQVELPWPGG